MPEIIKAAAADSSILAPVPHFSDDMEDQEAATGRLRIERMRVRTREAS